MPTNVLVVNGAPRAGKDTLVELLRQEFAAAGHYFDSMSSIDPIRDMLTMTGIDTSAKTAADRKLLADIGTAVEEHSEWRTNQCLRFAVSASLTWRRHNPVLVIHMREPENIDRLAKKLASEGINLWRILVTSHRSDIAFSNEADASTGKMAADFVVTNDGTLEELQQNAAALVSLLKKRMDFRNAA